jgi:oxygen-independent coproporphyrinogen-3 oxidase
VAEEAWRASIEKTIELAPEHVSAYALSIEEGTVFARRQSEGRFSSLDEEQDAEQYEWIGERLISAGYVQYEVSNFSRPGKYSRHNWSYWTGAEYLGVGLSAHSYVRGRRFWNVRNLYGYVERIERDESPEEACEHIDATTARRERFWLGVRTHLGVELVGNEEQLLRSAPRFALLSSAGHWHIKEGRLVLSAPALALADALAVEVTNILEGGTGVASPGNVSAKECVESAIL